MTPLLLVGATSVAKYLVSRAEAHVPALPLSGNSAPNFGAVLRAAVGPKNGSSSPESEARDLERQLASRPEVKAALSALPDGANVAIQVQQDGAVSIVGGSGRIDLSLSDETRGLAQQVFAANVQTNVSRTQISPNGIAAVSLPFRISKGV